MMITLPDKNLFRISEAAEWFDVTERTIRLWVEHAHLEAHKIGGTVRITRESILQCRLIKRNEKTQIS
jgi:excisionase family DNA binding protein